MRLAILGSYSTQILTKSIRNLNDDLEIYEADYSQIDFIITCIIHNITPINSNNWTKSWAPQTTLPTRTLPPLLGLRRLRITFMGSRRCTLRRCTLRRCTLSRCRGWATWPTLVRWASCRRRATRWLRCRHRFLLLTSRTLSFAFQCGTTVSVLWLARVVSRSSVCSPRLALGAIWSRLSQRRTVRCPTSRSVGIRCRSLGWLCASPRSRTRRRLATTPRDSESVPLLTSLPYPSLLYR